MERYQPDVVVTYDPNGFYGHPDHIQTHRVTMAALRTMGPSGQGVLDHGAALEDGGIRRGHARARRRLGRAGRSTGGEPQPEIGLPDDEITTWVDTSEFGRQKFDALAAHASQSENIFFLRMGPERFTELMGVETFVRVPAGSYDHPVANGEREIDLFAGVTVK